MSVLITLAIAAQKTKRKKQLKFQPELFLIPAVIT